MKICMIFVVNQAQYIINSILIYCPQLGLKDKLNFT